MSMSRLFYWLFSGSLVVLFCLLGYGFYVMYGSENKKIQEDIDQIVQQSAAHVQDKNLGAYDMIKALNEKDFKEKVAFAAGLTQNKNRMSWGMDAPADLQKVPVAADAQSVKTQKREGANDSLEVKINKQLPKGMTIKFYDSTNQPLKVPKKSGNVGRLHDTARFTFTIPGTKPADIKTGKAQIDPSGKYIPEGLITIQGYDSLLQMNLEKEGLTVPHHVEQVARPLSDAKWASGYFIIDFYEPVVYREIYTIPGSLLAKRLLPYTGISLFLLSIVSAAFLLYHKSYKMQLQTAQFRESLLSNVTHELKTPVASLQLIINSLQGEKESAQKQQEYIDFADKELGRMKNLIEKILSFSKLNERQFALNKEIINLSVLVGEAVEIVAPAVANTCGTIRFEQQAAPEVLGDRILLLNMIVNLADNALKYSMKKPTIHIRLSAEKGFAKITVADNGIGIPAQYQKKIFEPFFRVPTGNKYDTPGHGIGLSFVKQTVALHNGNITVESEKEEGSTFIITLPSL